MKSFYLIILFFFILFYNIHSQDFGEIPEELLKMTNLPEDPEEDAAIIFDKCEVKINSEFDLEIFRHQRIKVFTEEGKKQANIKIVTYHKNDVSKIDAIAISPDGKEYELDSDNIFEEEAIRTKTVSFAVPGVEVGSVFDVKYRIYSEYISNLEPWSFQSDIFTKYSEIKVYMPSGFTYQKLAINLDAYDLQENYEAVPDRNNSFKKVGIFTWSCKNLPGIKDEPYTDNIDDNYAQLYFVLVGYVDQYVNLKFSENWEAVSKDIFKYYDDLIDNDDAEETVKKLITPEMTELNKAKKIYEFIRTEIKTTDHKALLGDDFKIPEKVLSEKSGSSSEKSMLLINMLQFAGLNVKPVWISTRINGKIIKDFCDRTQFNRLICLLQIGTQNYYLYPSPSSIEFGSLPFQLDVSEGLLIAEEKGNIVSVKSANTKGTINIRTEAKIDSQKTLKAKSQIIYSGPSAVDERDGIQDKGAETYFKDYFKGKFADATIDTFYYSNIDSIYLPLIVNFSFTIPNYLEETEPLGYFKLPFISGIKDNPFTKQKRTNPIDFRYPELNSETIKVEFPDNYTASQLPVKKKRLITNAGFNQVYNFGTNYVECSRTLDLNNRKFITKNYLDIKSLFDDIVSSINEQVVITKKVQTGKK
jgi:hypothetical protein